MNTNEKLRYMDFLSIGLEELESGNHDVAREFIDDVRVGLLNANEEELSQTLQHGLNKLDEGKYSSAKTAARGVHEELMDE